MKLELRPYEEKMKKTIAVLTEDYDGIRVGRANPKVLDKIKVDYYGSPAGLDGVASVKSPDPRTLLITPWETNMLKPIEKAIMASDLGITPQNDGKSLRLCFPTLTEERRKDLVKEVKKKAEEGKVAIRNIRRDGNDAFKKLAKTEDVSEDEIKQLEEKLQKMTDKYVKEIDDLMETKSKEIMTV